MEARRDEPQVTVIAPHAELLPQLADANVPSGRPVVILFGGAAGIEEEAGQRLYTLIRDGIVKTAVEIGAVVVDGGTASGVMSLAGRARAELSLDLPLIGVAPIGKVKAGGIPAATGSTALDENHSHILLAPGQQWGDESPVLMDIAHTLAGDKPVVAVLVDGGPIALAEAMEASARGWPLVAVDGSGRMADLVAAYSRGAELPGVTADRSRIHVTDMNAGGSAIADTIRALLTLHRVVAPVSTAATEPAGTIDAITAGPTQRIDYPALYVAASDASKSGQTTIKVLSILEIGLTLLGLVIATVAKQVAGASGNGWVIAGSALPLLLAPILKLLASSSGFERDWFNGRSVAETVKSLSWRYMMRSEPYQVVDADQAFTSDLATILRRRPDIRQALNSLPNHPAQITPVMRSVRQLDIAGRRDVYATRRLDDQANWYRRKSASSRRWATIWFWTSVAFQLVAAGAAITALVMPGNSELPLTLVSILASASLAGTAWTQLSRYDEMAKSYAVALQEVLLVASLARDFQTDDELNKFVDAGELAISRENSLWVARRLESAELIEAALENSDSGQLGR